MEKKKNSGIQSIEVGFKILTVMMNYASPLPLKLLSEKSGLTPSKIHFYLVSFIKLGMVIQDPNTNHYSLGPFALQLGMGYLDQVNLFASAKPIMENLALEFGHTIFLGVWGNRGATIINRVDGKFSQTVFDLRIGSVLPLLNSALGKNFAAHLPPNIIEPLIDEEIKNMLNNLENVKELVALKKEEIKEELADVKKNGISRSRAKLLSDFTALSVPIFDFSGNIIAGLTVMGRINVFDDDYKGAAAKQLITAGLELSKERGFRKKI